MMDILPRANPNMLCNFFGTYRQEMGEPLDCSTPGYVLDLCVRRDSTSSNATVEEDTKPYIMNRNFDEPSTVRMLSPDSQTHSDPCSEESETSTSSDLYRDAPLQYTSPTSTYRGVPTSTRIKMPRPFKAYPKDPAIMAAATDPLVGMDTAEAYARYREKMLSSFQAAQTTTNKNMRRCPRENTASNADPNYWEKRRKNNAAAKRSRDARRAKEDELAIRTSFLEQENLRMKYQLVSQQQEIERLNTLLLKQCST